MKDWKNKKKFILEIDKEKNIFRQTHLTGYKRQGKRCGAFLAYGADGLFAQRIRQ